MVNNMIMLIRRELWEHKALVFAPLVMASLMVFGFVVAFVTAIVRGLPFEAAVASLELTGAPGALTGGSALAGVPWGILSLVLSIVVFFYCIDALFAERKDKSILFWRSLPVTDTETVLSKLLTATLAAPLITMVITIATQIILLLLASLVVLMGGGNPIELVLAPLPLFQFWILTLYMSLTAALWLVPIAAYLLLCSAFAKRSSLLWAFLPVVVIMMLEGIALQNGRFAVMIGQRLSEAHISGLRVPDTLVTEIDLEQSEEVVQELLMGKVDLLSLLAPGQFIASPGLWVGFLIAALFVAGAVYFRRARA